MLPFDQIAPTIPLLNILRKGEETIACTMAVYTVVAVITVKRRTALSSSFRYSVRRISGGRIFIHRQKKCNNFVQNLEKVVNNPSALWNSSLTQSRVNASLAIVFARLLIQYGAGNCKKA